MSARITLGATAFITLLFPTCVIHPFFHNRYVDPVGRLLGQIEVGQACDEVSRRFADYVARAGSSDASFNDHELTSDLLFTEKIPASRGLSLYDTNIFDDLQIRVRCDSDNRVAEKLVILD